MSVPFCGIILAAGMSSRMGNRNKLTTVWNGKPLICHVANAALESRLDKVALVAGHEAEAVLSALPRERLLVTHNSDYAGGLAGSLRAGIYRLQGLARIMVLLGDMPLVTAAHIDALIRAFERQASDETIVVATANGAWGNPVLFGTEYFAQLKMLDGDMGARGIMKAHADHVIDVDIGEAARRDFDMPESFQV